MVIVLCACMRVLSQPFQRYEKLDDATSGLLVSRWSIDPTLELTAVPRDKKEAKCLGITDLGLLSLGILGNAPDHLEVLLNHLLHQVVEGGTELPSNLFLGLGGVTEEKFDFGRSEVAGINLHKLAALIGSINSDLIDGSGLASPLDGSTNNLKGLLDKLTDGVSLSGSEDVVIGLILLKHAPHTLDVVAGMAPITLGVDVSEVEALVDALMDAGDGGGDLTGDEGLATAGTLVVEEDAVGKVHAVSLTVVHKDPEGVLLGDSIGRTGVEGGGLGLGNLADLAVQLGGGGLVEFDLLLHAAGADGIEHAEDANTIGIGGVLGHIEGNLDVGHGAEVVNLIGLHLGNDGDQVRGIAKVAVVEEKLNAGGVAILVDVINTAGVEGRRTTDDAVDNVALLEEELGEVGTILAGDTGDEGDLGLRHG
mmetsp:Transcript_17850/g.51104  ORF Transcript_17850/g.51104 Transcript_17850/m.51104 type:complete len:423 (-) Transcript_17850:52-1320(-)